MEKTELFVCRCHDVSHQLVLETLETEEDEERVVYGCFHIVHLEFWEKLKSAMKYIQMVDCVSPMTFFKYRQKSRMNSSVSSFMDISLRLY